LDKQFIRSFQQSNTIFFTLHSTIHNMSSVSSDYEDSSWHEETKKIQAAPALISTALTKQLGITAVSLSVAFKGSLTDDYLSARDPSWNEPSIF
jgi:hypothetical protein